MHLIGQKFLSVVEEFSKMEEKKKIILKEWRCKPGSMSSLYLKKTELNELPKIEKNQVLVKTTALGLNFADVISVLGLYEGNLKFPVYHLQDSRSKRRIYTRTRIFRYYR